MSNPPPVRRQLLSSLTVSLIVFATGAAVFALSALLFLFARQTPQISGSFSQRWLVSVASACFGVLGLAGCVFALVDLIRRLRGPGLSPVEGPKGGEAS